MVLLILCGVIYFLYKLLLWILFVFENTQNEVSIAVLGVFGTILTGIIVTVITQKQSKQREVDELHRPKKVEIYKEFLEIFTRLMCNDNKNVTTKKINNEELLAFLVDFRTNILLWGSPKIISEYLKFLKLIEGGGKSFVIMNDFIKYIREDIGLSNKGLNKNELIKMFLDDPDELDDLIKNS